MACSGEQPDIWHQKAPRVTPIHLSALFWLEARRSWIGKRAISLCRRFKPEIEFERDGAHIRDHPLAHGMMKDEGDRAWLAP